MQRVVRFGCCYYWLTGCCCNSILGRRTNQISTRLFSFLCLTLIDVDEDDDDGDDEDERPSRFETER